MTEFIEVSNHGRVMCICMNRQQQLNAITHDMYAALADALHEATTNADIRAVVLSGKGSAFTAGNDLADFAAGMPEGKPPVFRFLEGIRDFSKPLIAAVNGTAIGVGTTMLLHCDLVFCANSASFRAGFAHLGLVPEAGSSLLMEQALGSAWANELFIAGRTLNSAEALTAGLVTRVFDDEELLSASLEVAKDIAAQAPNAMRLSKSLIRDSRSLIAEQMMKEAELFDAQLKSEEFKEVITAFMERRPPSHA